MKKPTFGSHGSSRSTRARTRGSTKPLGSASPQLGASDKSPSAPAPAFGGGAFSLGKPFGGAGSGGVAFGAAPAPAFGVAAAAPLFGGFSPPKQGGLFGAAPAQPGGLFGAAPAQGGGLFGAAPAQGGGLFGAAPAQPSGLFGAAPVPAFQGFGAPKPGGLFGAAPAPAFGAASPPKPASGFGSGFGAAPAPAFGAPKGGAFGGGFGAAPAPVFGGAFGGASAFGAAPASAFGASSFGGSSPKPKEGSIWDPSSPKRAHERHCTTCFVECDEDADACPACGGSEITDARDVEDEEDEASASASAADKDGAAASASSAGAECGDASSSAAEDKSSGADATSASAEEAMSPEPTPGDVVAADLSGADALALRTTIAAVLRMENIVRDAMMCGMHLKFAAQSPDSGSGPFDPLNRYALNNDWFTHASHVPSGSLINHLTLRLCCLTQVCYGRRGR